MGDLKNGVWPILLLAIPYFYIHIIIALHSLMYFVIILRSVLGQAELDELLAAREKINQELQTILDKLTDPWGIKVGTVEIKHVDLPQEMQRAMARQAEAERDRRAKVINALGEFQASQKLAEAATVIGDHPMALQLRYLQTLSEVAAENNSTIVFPVPIDLFKPFQKMMMGKADGEK